MEKDLRNRGLCQAIADLTATLEPPRDRVGLPELVTAVQMLGDELRGIRCLLVRVLNERERRNDE